MDSHESVLKQSFLKYGAQGTKGGGRCLSSGAVNALSFSLERHGLVGGLETWGTPLVGMLASFIHLLHDIFGGEWEHQLPTRPCVLHEGNDESPSLTFCRGS